MEKFKKVRGAMLLFVASFIWGTAFVAQSLGNSIGSLTFLAVRSYIGFVFIFIVLIFLEKKESNSFKLPVFNLNTIKYGTICGVILFFASAMQQIGLNTTSAGKAGFLTALYIVIVPILGIFLKHKLSPIVVISVVIALCGTYLLSVKDGFSIELGDSCIILSALLFSIHILSIDKFAPKLNAVKLSCFQFLICAVLGTFGSLIFETPSFNGIISGIGPLLYAGIMSSGIAFTLQIIAQKETPPVIASLIMSLESVFAALAGWVILKEVLSTRELFGCGLVFFAVLLAQSPMLFKKNK